MRVPRATYRVQFRPSFGFEAAKSIISYLAELGISHIYASPIFKTKKGSLHGYDVVDPNQINPELGPLSDFEELIGELGNCEMGWLQDVVPNHMAFDGENAMLMDVLEKGESSEYHNFFDIEWNHPYESIRGRVLAPFLGTFFSESLENGDIKLVYDDEGLWIKYYQMSFPLKIESYVKVFTHQLEKLKKRIGREHPDFIKFLGITYVLKSLPSKEEIQERNDQITFAKRMFWELYSKNQQIRQFIEENIGAFNGRAGDPWSFHLLDDLLSEQLFRLSFWKVATEEINYRRFFNINELISLRVEDEQVFDHTHSLIFKLIQQGKITGLRIDHVDGLYDPTSYLKRMRERTGEMYIVVEKILDLEEELPPFWPVQGTTGYDFLNYANGIFCKKENEKQFKKLYSLFTGLRMDYADLVSGKKRLIIGKDMEGDIDNLAHFMKWTSSKYRYGTDITLYGLKRALVEMTAQFFVYRTYISKEGFRQADFSYIKRAVEKAIQSNPGIINELRFIERFLLLDFDEYLSQAEKDQWIHFVMRFQQFTGPLMAKGFEDTTLYIYNRLISLNEVGGSPDRFGISLERFHRLNEKRAHIFPYSLNATSTHDTKRGEDIRARINVLSEIPEEWERHLRTWGKINRRKKKKVKGMDAPDRNDEYFLYQTLIGAFPFYESEYPEFIERIKNYIIKAVREGKIYTGWLKPDTDYEDAYLSFVEGILSPPKDSLFMKEFLPFQKKIAHYGVLNSLSQTLIKMTSPGIPDFYQGTELWDLNLVDPDNRRLVDFEKRRAFLSDVKEKINRGILRLIPEILSRKEDGRIKLFLIYRTLKARNEQREVFQHGTYEPLETLGRFKDHLIAFLRKYGGNWAITVAPRFSTGLVKEGEYPMGEEIWHDTRIALPEGAPLLWKDAIPDQSIKSENSFLIGEVLKFFPVSLLISEERL